MAQILLKTDASSTQERSINTELGNQNTNNTELYAKDAAQDILIAANTEKVGITTAQASAISANTAKISFDSTSSARLADTSGTNTGDQDLSGLQATLVSGTNIKTVNGTSLLGSGNIVVDGGDGASAVDDLTDVDTTGKSEGKILKFDASGNLVVGSDLLGEAGGGITEVVAGDNLSGGGTSTTVTLNLDTATIAAIASIAPFARFEVTGTSTLIEDNIANTIITNYAMSAGGETTLPAISGAGRVTLFVESASQDWSLKPPLGEAFVLDGVALDANDKIDCGATIGNSLVLSRIRVGASDYQWYAYTVDGVFTDGGV